jgi:hypothetical protein
MALLRGHAGRLRARTAVSVLSPVDIHANDLSAATLARNVVLFAIAAAGHAAPRAVEPLACAFPCIFHGCFSIQNIREHQNDATVRGKARRAGAACRGARVDVLPRLGLARVQSPLSLCTTAHPDSLRDLMCLFLKRQCDQTLGLVQPRPLPGPRGAAARPPPGQWTSLHTPPSLALRVIHLIPDSRIDSVRLFAEAAMQLHPTCQVLAETEGPADFHDAFGESRRGRCCHASAVSHKI